MNTAEIISNVTMTLSFINSKKDFDFVGCKMTVSICEKKNSHDVSSLLALVKTVVAFQHMKNSHFLLT